MRSSVSSFAAGLMALTSVIATAGTAVGGDHLALASCPDRAAAAGEAAVGELIQNDVDKASTVAAVDLLKEYLDFHDQAQAATGVRAALMPWSNLATHAN
jgi:hypothetical protein